MDAISLRISTKLLMKNYNTEIIEVTDCEELRIQFHELLRQNLFHQDRDEYYDFDHDNFYPDPCVERVQLLFMANGEAAAVGTLDILDGQRAALRGVAVSQSWQGQGMGRAFIDAVCKLAESRCLELVTVLASPNSSGFYLRCGFNAHGGGQRPSPEKREGLVQLQKTISPSLG